MIRALPSSGDTPAPTRRSAGSSLFLPPETAKVLILALLVLVPIWLVLLFAFKSELNRDMDELNYHTIGAYMGEELLAGRYFDHIGDRGLMHYPGYYSIIAAVYALFGAHHQVVRFLNFLPFIGVAVVSSNIARLVSGPKAAQFALLASLMNPLLTMFALLLIRDIYIVFGVAVILHHMIGSIACRRIELSRGAVFPLAIAYSLLATMRTPQAILMGLFHLLVIVVVVAFGSKRYRLFGSIAGSLLLVALWRSVTSFAVAEADSALFDRGQVSVEVSLGSTSDTVNSVASYWDALVSAPGALLLAYAAKLTGHLLGPTPFAEVTGPTYSVFEPQFNRVASGGFDRIDIVLSETLFFGFMAGLCAFAVAGILELAHSQKGVFLALCVLWLCYATTTLLIGNDARWGLPLFLLVFIFQAHGWSIAEGSRLTYVVSFCILLLAIGAIRVLGIKVPILVSAIVWAAVAYPRLRRTTGTLRSRVPLVTTRGV